MKLALWRLGYGNPRIFTAIKPSGVSRSALPAPVFPACCWEQKTLLIGLPLKWDFRCCNFKHSRGCWLFFLRCIQWFLLTRLDLGTRCECTVHNSRLCPAGAGRYPGREGRGLGEGTTDIIPLSVFSLFMQITCVSLDETGERSLQESIKKALACVMNTKCE